MISAEQLRQQWTDAKQKVREAEDRLHQAWQAFASGQSGPPEKGLIEEVSRLRRECDQKLAALLDQQSKPGPGRPERPRS